LVQDCSSLLGCEASLGGVTAQASPHATIVKLGLKAFGQAPPCVITSHGTVQDSHCPFPRVRDPWGGALGSIGEGSSPRVLELVKRGFCFCQMGLSCNGVIMSVMRVEGEEALSPDLRGLESGAREPSC
jgi:hypothetical protein